MEKSSYDTANLKPSYSEASALPQQAEGAITKIPIELLKEVFSYLDKHEDIQSSAMVNSVWKEGVVDQLKTEQSELAESYIRAVIKNLDEKKYPNVINDLKSLLDGNKIFNSVSLLQVKTSLDSIKELIIKQLKNVDRDDLKLLMESIENYKAPVNFAGLIEYALLSKDKSLNRLSQGGKPLIDIMVQGKILAKNGKFDEAITLAKSIQFGFYKSLVFDEIINRLMDSGNVDKAYETVIKDAPESDWDRNLHSIIKRYCENGDFSKAREAANRIQGYGNDKEYYLSGIEDWENSEKTHNE